MVAWFGELWGKVGELREHFIDKTDSTAEGICMYVFCKKTTDITFESSLVMYSNDEIPVYTGA